MNIALLVLICYVLITVFGILIASLWNRMHEDNVPAAIQYLTVTGFVLLLSVGIAFVASALAIP